MESEQKQKPQGKKSAFKNAVLNLLLIVCTGVFCFSGWKLFSALYEYKKGETNYEAILNQAVTFPKEEEEDFGEQANQAEEILPIIDWASLKEINSDYIGWLYIPDTRIQYPIVQGADNEYYLTHTFDKTANSCGAIFMDMDNQSDFSSDNTLLHGHNMKNGSMFGTLRKYKDQAHWEQHPYIWIIKEHTAAKYEIFSTEVTDVFSDVYTLEFGSEESFQKFLNNRKNAWSSYETGVDVTTSDKILTLSTCTSAAENERRVVFAKLVEEKVID